MMPLLLIHSVGVVVTNGLVGVGVVIEGFVRGVVLTGGVVGGGVVTGGFVGADVGAGPVGIVHVEDCGGEHVLRLIRLDESHPLLRK